MFRECERTAIIALTQGGVTPRPKGLFHCPTWGCTAVFYYKGRGEGLQLVEGEKRCDKTVAERAELRKMLDENNPFKIRNPEDKLALRFRLYALENEISGNGFDRDLEISDLPSASQLALF